MLQVDKSEAQKLTWQNSVESIEEYMLSPTSQNPDIQYVAMIGNSSVYYVSQELVSATYSYTFTVIFSDRSIDLLLAR